MRSTVILILAIGLVWSPLVSHAQSVYDRSIVPFEASLQHDSTTTRGGISIYIPPGPGSQTIYSGSVSIQGICGFDFDFNVLNQIARFLESAPELLNTLIPGILYVLTCQFFPSACDAFKHIQGYVNQTLRFLKADCQKIMQLGHLAGISNRSEAEAACVRDQLNDHGDMEIAINACSAGLASLRGPNGIAAPEINLMESFLETTGIEPEWQDALQEALPNFVLSTTGDLFNETASSESDVFIRKYTEETEINIEEITAAVAAIEGGGGEVPGGLQYLGGPIPSEALAAIALMQADRADHEIKKLASNMALSKILYDGYEAAGRYHTSLQVASLSNEQRRLLERGYTYMINEMDRLQRMHSIPNNTVRPQLDGLFEYKADREAWAANSIIRNPGRGKSNVMLPETGQNIFGYAQ